MRDRMRCAVIGAACALGVLGSAPALAHHSFAMFDNEHQIKLIGTVKEFQWTNPHVYIEADVLDDKGKTRHWSVECANPGILNRIGWKFNMIKPGDELKMVVAPMRSGQPAALLKEVVLPDGRVFSNGGPAGPAKIHF